MSTQRTNAKIAGCALILMAVMAGFAMGFAYPEFSDKSNIELLHRDLTEHYGLYQQMLFGVVVIIILDVLVSWTLYQFFKNDNEKIAITSLVLRLIYTFFLGIAACYLVANLKEGIGNNILHENYNAFERIWTVGLIIFGGHLVAVGILMKAHKNIPKLLWTLTLFAGVAYIIVHSLKVLFPRSGEFIMILNNVLSLPMALGEICLAIWLIVKGGKQNEVKVHLS